MHETIMIYLMSLLINAITCTQLLFPQQNQAPPVKYQILVIFKPASAIHYFR